MDELQKLYPDPYTHFQAVAKEKNKAEELQRRELTFTLDPNKKIIMGVNRKNFGYAIISKVYHELGIDTFLNNRKRYIRAEYNLNAIMKMLVYSRLLAPASKKKTHEERGRYFDTMDFSLDDVYRSLTQFNKYKDDLQLWIHEHIRANHERDTSIIFYDVTNYYFEIDEQDELRRKGVSKEHRPDPIVQMGLFMDNDGLPIAYHLFPGNCNDCLTLLPLMKIIRAKYALGKAVVVADRGMNTNKNAYYLANSRGGYIFSQTVRGGSDELKSYILKSSGYKELEGTKGFKKKSRQFTRIIKFKDDDGTEINAQIAEKQLVFYSPDYDKREKALRAPAIEKARDLIKNPGKYKRHNSYGAAKYVIELQYDKKTGEILTPAEMLRFDEEKLMEEEQYDGYYLIVTSRHYESDEWMLAHYKGLWQIEETFKVTKSDLEARPVHVSLEEHINSHFLVCFIALVIIKLIHRKLGRIFSPETIIENLSNACCTHLEENWYVFDHRNEALDAIGDAFGIDFSKKYMTHMDIRKALGSTKK